MGVEISGLGTLLDSTCTGWKIWERQNFGRVVGLEDRKKNGRWENIVAVLRRHLFILCQAPWNACEPQTLWDSGRKQHCFTQECKCERPCCPPGHETPYHSAHGTRTKDWERGSSPCKTRENFLSFAQKACDLGAALLKKPWLFQKGHCHFWICVQNSRQWTTRVSCRVGGQGWLNWWIGSWLHAKHYLGTSRKTLGTLQETKVLSQLF